MTPKEFLSHFPDFCIQVFDDVEMRKDPKLAKCGKPSVFTKEQLQKWNKEGRGIFFSVNKAPTGERKKEHCAGINAWFAESDTLSAEEQWQRIIACPLEPSFVVRSKKSFHIYWLSTDGTKERFEEVQNGLIKYFDGDPAMKDIVRVLRVPGFNHMKDPANPFPVEIITANPELRYTEAEMLQAFPYEKPPKKEYVKRERKSNDFWDVLSSLDNKMMLEKLSGDSIINGEVISFRPRHPEGAYIDVNGKPAAAWLDAEGFIGSTKKGGPTWIQWITYYGRTHGEIAKWAEQHLKEHINMGKKETTIVPVTDMRTPVQKQKIVPISQKDLLEKQIPPVKWIVEGMVPANGLAILTAPPEHYKTWIMLVTAIAVAEGKNVFGENGLIVPSSNGVVICNEEMWEGSIQERLRNLGAKLDLPITYTNLCDVRLDKEEDVLFLISLCKEKNAKLIIFDSLVRVHGYDENSASEMKKVFDSIKKFTKEGIAVLLTHHNRKPPPLYGSNKPKDDVNSMRGSSDIRAIPDVIWGIRTINDDKNTFALVNYKQRLAEKYRSFKIQIVKNEKIMSFIHAGAYTDEDEKSNKVMESMNTVLTFIEQNPDSSTAQIKDAMKVLQIGDHTTRDALRLLEEDGVIMVNIGKSEGGRKCNIYRKIDEYKEPEQDDLWNNQIRA